MRLNETIVQRLLAVVSYWRKDVVTVAISVMVYVGLVAGPGKTVGKGNSGERGRRKGTDLFICMLPLCGIESSEVGMVGDPAEYL